LHSAFVKTLADIRTRQGDNRKLPVDSNKFDLGQKRPAHSPYLFLYFADRNKNIQDNGVSQGVSKYKVIFTGPVGAGKTAAVKAVSDTQSLVTDVAVTDIASLRKSTTTVAMDYGVVALPQGDLVHVYGTPGQERFDFMWDILLKGADGLIILLDHTRNNPFRDLKNYTEAFAAFIRPGNTLVGISHFDRPGTVALETYQQWAKDLGIDGGAFPVDSRSKADVLSLLTTLLQPSREDAMPDQPVTPPRSDLASPPPDARLTLDESILEGVGTLPGVVGVSLTSAMGELLHSSIEDEALNEFIAFLSGLTPNIEEAAGMGEMRRITLKSPQNENLTVFVENGRSLGILSQPRVSMPLLGQQVEDMLQWA
jgi:signal recognition particle receptor subunit beta